MSGGRDRRLVVGDDHFNCGSVYANILHNIHKIVDDSALLLFQRPVAARLVIMRSAFQNYFAMDIIGYAAATAPSWTAPPECAADVSRWHCGWRRGRYDASCSKGHHEGMSSRRKILQLIY